MTRQCIKADYQNPKHGDAIIKLLNAYAIDPMGGASPLNSEVQATLINKLAKRPEAITLLYYIDSIGVGLINAFEGFSTFAAAPLINVHDVYITPKYRGQGILREMFDELEAIAHARGCCKLTLEVLSNNERAMHGYRSLGFAEYTLKESAGHALFWQKRLA